MDNNFASYISKKELDAFKNGEYAIVHDGKHDEELLTLFELCKLECYPPLPDVVYLTFYWVVDGRSWYASNNYPKNRVLFIQDLFKKIGYNK